MNPPRPVHPRALSIFRVLLLAFQLVCLSFAAPAQQQPTANVPVAPQTPNSADAVRLTVTVTDGKGRYVTGLGKDHFSVTEGKTPREIDFFDSADAPASVGVLLDVSGSMTGWSDEVRLAVGQFVLKGHPNNEYFIADFNTRGNILTDWTSDPARLTRMIQQVGATLGKDRARGNTALYDACAGALAKLAEGRHVKRVLVVISDGQDNASRMSFGELRRRVQASDVLVYCLGPVQMGNPGSLDVGGQALLDELAARSGGVAFFPEGKSELIAAAERIAVELRHQYVVGFAPGAGDGAGEAKWRKIKIKVTAPSKEVKGIVARSREGYFSPRARG